MVLAALLATLGCGDDPLAPALQIIDRDRHARVTADGQKVIYYRNDERPGAVVGIYRVELASGDVRLLVQAILAGLDLHPQTDSIVFSARETGDLEPALWLMGLDGGGVRRLVGGGDDPGFRWPAFSADGAHIAWEARFQAQAPLDTVSTLWIGEWLDGAIANPRAVGPGRRSAWRPDGAALVVESRRPNDAVPRVIVVMDTTGQLLDTLGFGDEPVWEPNGQTVAYLAELTDRGCTGVCFVPATGGSPVSLATTFMTFPGSWSRDGAAFVFARLMRTYEIEGNPTIVVQESRLWLRTLATGADRQLTF